MRTVICPYYIINNDEEFEKANKILKNKNVRLHPYPFAIGKEEDFVFQGRAADNFDDYHDKKEDVLYKYIKKEFE